jgi:nifR3 family TIM-barrel protein
MGFWARLTNKPFFALAPMADVTDPAFRQLIAKYSRHGQPNGGPDVFWTEFVSANGLASEGRKVLERDLEYTEGERPIVAQLFTSNPENMKKAARLCAELGFDGIDINMGCPDKTIEKQGAGACMMKTPDVAVAMIKAVKEGAGDLPVSVKTRVGYNKVEIEEWIPALLAQNIAALTIHARTRKELSAVPADWSRVKRVVEIRNALKVPTLIIGNGDVTTIEDGLLKAKQTGCDGIMIGRAIFGNPWLFDRDRRILQKGTWKTAWYSKLLPGFLARKLRGGDARYTVSDVDMKEKLLVLAEHCELFEQKLGDIKSFSIMKKHFKAYINGFPGAKELRVELMEKGENAAKVREHIEAFIAKS